MRKKISVSLLLSMNLLGISSKRILITGATSGLGMAMAKVLVSNGANVFIGSRDKQKIDNLVGSLNSGVKGRCLGTCMDVRCETSILRGIEEMISSLGGIDILINNAGIGMRTVNPNFLVQPMPFWTVPAAAFRDLIETNLTGYFLVAKAAVPHLLRGGQGGRIINISMNHETMVRRGFVPYGPSRAGADALSRIMAQDLAPHGVTVNLLLPGGATATGMIPEGASSLPPGMRDALLPPSVMDEAVLFLCSDAAAAVHDQRIVARDFRRWHAEWRTAAAATATTGSDKGAQTA